MENYNVESKDDSALAENSNQQNLLSRFASFAIFRYTANIEWVAGTVGGNAAVEQLGTNQWLTAGAVGLGIALLEYPQTALAMRRTNDVDETDNVNISNKSLVAKEATLGWSSLWQGAAATVTVNESLGVKSTPRRRKVQSALYGLAVAAWVTPIPPFEQLAGTGENAIENAVNNPVESIVGGVVATGVIFAGLETYKKFRQNRQLKKEK